MAAGLMRAVEFDTLELFGDKVADPGRLRVPLRGARPRPQHSADGSGCLHGAAAVSRMPRRLTSRCTVLADAAGNTVHLFERDCSVQQRHHGKVVEIAPAPAQLDAAVAPVRHARRDAVQLPCYSAPRLGYLNAGTVEFLVAPETGEHFFIECNPRIQVEHTVTEQVTGIDLVEAQFQLAAGETLAVAGHRQPGRRDGAGKLVQARVVATGWRRDQRLQGAVGRGRAGGCRGLPRLRTAASQFDPLLAKVVGTAGTYAGGAGPYVIVRSRTSTSRACRRISTSCGRSLNTRRCASATLAPRCCRRCR